MEFIKGLRDDIGALQACGMGPGVLDMLEAPEWIPAFEHEGMLYTLVVCLSSRPVWSLLLYPVRILIETAKG